MAGDPALGFFDPTDPLDINTALALAGPDQWIVQSHNPTAALTRVAGLAANGDEGAYTTIDGKTSGTVTYECFKVGGAGLLLTLPIAGQVYGGFHVDSVKLVYAQNKWPTLEISFHNHAENPHAASSCNRYVLGRTSAGKVAQFPAGFGCPVSILDNAVAPVTYFAMAHATIGIKTLTFALAVTHQDETGSAGDHLAGENRDGKETMEADFVGIPTTVTKLAAFVAPSSGSTQTNQAADTAKYSFERHLQREAA